MGPRAQAHGHKGLDTWTHGPEPKGPRARVHGPMGPVRTQVQHDYRSFLGLGLLQKVINWARVGCLPEPDEMNCLLADGCSCSIDPMQICLKHVCRCEMCRNHGATHALCQWRQHALEFLSKKFPALLGDPQELHKLTYVQVAECHGITTFSSPRERNALNIISRLPKVGPLESTLANYDVSQAIYRANLKVDGSVGTMPTGAVIYSLRDAEVLTVPMMAKLMGRDVTNLAAPMSAVQYKRMLGMSFHPACAGMVLAAFLAAIGSSLAEGS